MTGHYREGPSTDYLQDKEWKFVSNKCYFLEHLRYKSKNRQFHVTDQCNMQLENNSGVRIQTCVKLCTCIQENNYRVFSTGGYNKARVKIKNF